MTTRRFFARSFVSLSVVVLLCVSVFADTIRLKDGSVIKGRITAFTGGKFTIAIGEGTSRRRELSFEAEEVESIAFDRNDFPNRSADVVTKPIPDFAIAIGAPAAVVRYRHAKTEPHVSPCERTPTETPQEIPSPLTLTHDACH